MNLNKTLRVLRLREVRARTGQATSTIYAAMASGKFPRPIPLGETRGRMAGGRDRFLD